MFMLHEKDGLSSSRLFRGPEVIGTFASTQRKHSASCRQLVGSITMRLVASLIDKTDTYDFAPECIAGRLRHGRSATSRRKQIRYPLRNSVLYLWEHDGIKRRGRGRTKDVSEEGLYVSSRNCPQQGDSVNLVFRLAPRSPGTPQPTVRMEMQASVLRIDRDQNDGEEIGFAVLRRDRSASTEHEFSSRPPRHVRTIVPWHLNRAN